MTTHTSSASSGMEARVEETTHSGNLWQKGFMAAIVATVINLVIFALGSLAGGLNVQDMANPALYAPVPWFMVVIMTVAPILLGVAVYWLLLRFMPNQATMIFVIGAFALALLSLFGPITAAETALITTLLSFMHLVAVVSLVYFVTR